MWATSGRSIRRAPGTAAASTRRGPVADSSSPPIDHEQRHAQLTEPPDRRRVEHDRVAVRLLLHVRLVGHRADRVARRGGRPSGRLPEAVDPDRDVVLGRGRPVLRLLERLARGRTRPARPACSRPRAPLMPPQTQASPETRSGYSSAVSIAIEPAREHPTSTARSSPAASITATRSARFENARVDDVRAAEPAQVVADDPVASGERLPLRIPLAHVGDPGVGEDDARALARHLERQPPAGDIDPALESVIGQPPGPGTPPSPSAAGSASTPSPGDSRPR